MEDTMETSERMAVEKELNRLMEITIRMEDELVSAISKK